MQRVWFKHSVNIKTVCPHLDSENSCKAQLEFPLCILTTLTIFYLCGAEVSFEVVKTEQYQYLRFLCTLISDIYALVKITETILFHIQESLVLMLPCLVPPGYHAAPA